MLLRYFTLSWMISGLVLFQSLPLEAQVSDEKKFSKQQITAEYFSEGAGIGDFNQDGVMDVVCGPNWYAGPEYQQTHRIYDGHPFPNDSGYSNNFFSYGYDINGDGWTDVVTIGFPSRAAHWYENPQSKGGDWPQHVALPGVDNESPDFLDITGDGQPEIICTYQGHLGYGTFDPKNPTAEWVFHRISDRGPWAPFTHGLGIGDVDGDGRIDMLTSIGWMEQPDSLDGDPIWEPHPFAFCPGGAQMFAFDVDGDGDNDVISSLNAHAWGLSWFEQVPGAGGEISFTPHVIMGSKPEENPYDVAFSQLHAVALHDMDGDGLRDIVTGKCYWAHNGHDPGARDPAVLYYFRLERSADGATFVPVQIDSDSGVGRQVTVGDVNGDEQPDIVVSNKKGLFVFQQSSAAPNQGAMIVDAQPLLAQVNRLQEALLFVGSPFPETTQNELQLLQQSLSDATVTTEVQSILDPHCLATLHLDQAADGQLNLSVEAGAAGGELIEQGWRTFLVKVVNRAGARAALDVSSPNAQAIPNAPVDDIDQRWLDLSMYNGRPLNPLLSGLPIEYRLIQVFSSQVGTRGATLRFRLGGVTESDRDEPRVVQQWTFDEDTDNWTSLQQCEIKAHEGILHVAASGHDAAITTPVESKAGMMELRVRMRSNKTGFAQVFWMLQDENSPHAERSAAFLVSAGGDQEYSVPMPIKGDMTALRFDPLHREAVTDIDWIRLTRVGAEERQWSDLDVEFTTEPSVPVTFSVLDEDGQPCMGGFVIRDQLGRVYPSPAKRLAPDFFFHPQVYRESGETIQLPAGEYQIECRRGPESLPETKFLQVGDEPTVVNYRVRRWIDPARFGWWSGDHHIHAAGCAHYVSPTQGVHAMDMARHCRGEDLKVGCNLTWGPCFDYQKQFFTGQVDQVSQYPYLMRYDIEVSGFGSHMSGHLCLLRLKDQIYPGGDSSAHWPTLGLNTLKWTKAQGAIAGPAHSGSGLATSNERVDGKDGPPLHGWSFNRQPLPNHFIPRFDGIGANEFIVDITHEVPGPGGQLVPAVDFISTMDTDRTAEWNMWYHTLNCGFRVRASGETDFPCISGERVGMGRVYVKLADQLDYDTWCEGIRQGRSYVSDGTSHLMDFRAAVVNAPQSQVEMGEQNSELQLPAPTRVRLRVKAALLWPESPEVPVELIVNGYPVDQIPVIADGQLRDLEFEVPIEKSSWIAIRSAHAAHTNPIFVLVDHQPIRASASSAEWCLKGVEQCWQSKKGTYADAELEQAEAAYEHARRVYRQLLEESRATLN